jgi:hypothetical protein
MKAISQGLTQIVNDPAQLAQIEAGQAPQDAALTTVHLDTVLNQVNQQISRFDPMYATNPNVAARSTNDNLLDMIDIVQNDPALNAAAGGNGTPGSANAFGELPAYLNGAEGMEKEVRSCSSRITRRRPTSGRLFWLRATRSTTSSKRSHPVRPVPLRSSS